MQSGNKPHSVLAKICRQITPPLNPDVMRGLATRYLKDAVGYIDTVTRRNFHEAVPGMEYMGYEVCTPEETFREITRMRSNRRLYDCASSSIFMIKIKVGLRVNGELQPFQEKYLSLPYCTDGGLMKLGGTLYHIKSVLTNKVISPGHKLLFVRMLGTRKNFFRIGYSIKVDGETKTTFVVHSAIYDAKGTSKKGTAPATTKAVSCMTHYLLLRYGYTEMCRKYLGHIPVVGTSKTITPENYPSTDWHIVSTAHIHVKPPGVVEQTYESSDIRIAVRKDKWDQGTISLISELFYVIDHFPTHVQVEHMDNCTSWRILLGYILVGGQYTIGRINSQMQEHLTSLDDFVDEFASDKLSEKGYEVRDFYDLAATLSMRFPDLLSENDRAGNIYEKYYDVIYHVMRPITYALTKTRYALQHAAKRDRPGRGDAGNAALFNSLNQVFIRRLQSGAVFNLNKDDTVLETVSYCGDHWYPRITSKVSEQEKASGGKGGSRRGMSDADHLDVSMIEGGSLLFLPKGNPTPVANKNPYVNIDARTGSIIPNPELKDLLERTKIKLDDK